MKPGFATSMQTKKIRRHDATLSSVSSATMMLPVVPRRIAAHASSIRRRLTAAVGDPPGPPPQLVQLSAVGGVATLTMQHAPVNALSLEMCRALCTAIHAAEADSSTQALVLRSAVPNIFSSGLALTEMHRPDPERLVEFWRSFQDLYFALYGSRLACIAAIEGHAPAAGCMLALSCDYRVMGDVPGIKIGLNESQFGIVAPPWLGRQMVDTVGRRQAELCLSLGTLYTPTEALGIQLVDDVVDATRVRDHAMQVAAQWAKIPPPARVSSKMLTRQERIDKLRVDRDADVQNFVGFITNETTQKNINNYLKMLSTRKNK